MTSQKTVERCRQERDELKAANAQLLENNVKLFDENAALRAELGKIKSDTTERIADLEKARVECASRCKSIVSAKEIELQKKQAYIDSLHSTFQNLKEAQWFYRVNQLPDGQIEITHTVKLK